MDFEFKNAYLNIRSYLIEYRGHEEIKSDFNQFQFDEPKCLKPDSSCKCAYVQCGHIRDLYFWPCENWYNFGGEVFSLGKTKQLNFVVNKVKILWEGHKI